MRYKIKNKSMYLARTTYQYIPAPVTVDDSWLEKYVFFSLKYVLLLPVYIPSTYSNGKYVPSTYLGEKYVPVRSWGKNYVLGQPDSSIPWSQYSTIMIAWYVPSAYQYIPSHGTYNRSRFQMSARIRRWLVRVLEIQVRCQCQWRTWNRWLGWEDCLVSCCNFLDLR